MNGIKEGGFTTCPLVLDGTNYSYKKARMAAFLKSIGNKTWKIVIIGWSHPTTKNVEGNEILKPELQGLKLKMKHPWGTLVH